MEKKFVVIVAAHVKFVEGVENTIDAIDSHDHLSIIDIESLRKSLDAMEVKEDKRYGFTCLIARIA
jgi:hypothetical protein